MFPLLTRTVLSLVGFVVVVVFGKSSPSCPSGQFLFRDRQCVLCHPTCSECTGHELFHCSACGVDEDGVERFLYLGHCVTHCPRSLYADRGISTCLPCLQNCELCTDASICAKCQDNYKLQSGRCQMTSCGKGQVQDPDTGECVDCETGCKTCSTENRAVCNSCNEGYFLFSSSSTCLSCLPGYFLNGEKCVKQCPQQTFGDTSGWRCQPCHSSCLSCRDPGPSDCELCQGGVAPVGGQCPGFTCSPDTTLMCEPEFAQCVIFPAVAALALHLRTALHVSKDGSCVERCPSGSFSNSVLGVCESCAPNCQLCADSSDNCVSCSKHGLTPFLHEGKCWSECPDGFFESEEGLCDPCEAPCHTCDGAGSQCLSCSDGYFLRVRHAD
ncbi:hypothetical protein WMY93_023503 [Mugilogobius chulae]|uniref:EGF-like domain-containing protein n=1 Tax=Mugilogobius chulae TaxID=88201 RepID=A0AAW0NFJ7_9GOBI